MVFFKELSLQTQSTDIIGLDFEVVYLITGDIYFIKLQQLKLYVTEYLININYINSYFI